MWLYSQIKLSLVSYYYYLLLLLHLCCSFPYFLSSQFLLSHLPSPIHFCSVSIHKRAGLLRISTKQEYEAAVRLGTFHLAIKAGKDNSVWEVESQKSVKDSETVLTSTIRSPTSRSSYITQLSKAQVRPLQTPCLLAQPVWACMCPGWLNLWALLWYPWPFWFLQSVLSLFHRILQVTPNVWL